MGTKKQMLDWLASQVGHVGGAKYWQDAYGWSGGGYPWCAVYVSDALKQTGTKCAYFPSKVAFDTRDKGAIGSAWVDRYNLQAGDAVAFDWDGDGSGDHVGWVIERLGYGYYKTNEGNVSNSVGIRYRRVTDGIIGGIRPQYSGEQPSSGLAVDGVFGTLTKKALQTRLKKAGTYSGGIDGDFGYWSKLALQKYLRVKGYYTSAYILDGDFGYYSVLALQKYLRNIGYYTTAYLLDGDWGAETTKAIQRSLNDGRF